MLCVPFEMQSPEAEEAVWLTRANFEIPQRQVAWMCSQTRADRNAANST